MDATPDLHDEPARRRLNRESILDGAATVIERDGAEAFSMRRLGTELGVEAMSLYHHFAARDELLRALRDQLFAPLVDLDLDVSWSEACRRFARAVREIAHARPATFRLVWLEPFDGLTSLRHVERLLAAMVAQGLSVTDALASYRTVASYTRGYALAEVAGFTVDAAAPVGLQRLRDLPVAEFPILRGRLDELAELDADSAFEHGLTAVLAGLVAEAGPAG